MSVRGTSGVLRFPLKPMERWTQTTKRNYVGQGDSKFFNLSKAKSYNKATYNVGYYIIGVS